MVAMFIVNLIKQFAPQLYIVGAVTFGVLGYWLAGRGWGLGSLLLCSACVWGHGYLIGSRNKSL